MVVQERKKKKNPLFQLTDPFFFVSMRNFDKGIPFPCGAIGALYRLASGEFSTELF